MSKSPSAPGSPERQRLDQHLYKKNGHAPNGRVPFEPDIITAVELMAMQFPEQRWAVEGIIPEGLSLLVGRPKQGKSWLLLSLGLAIAYGGKALGQIDVEQGDVLLLCLEDNRRRLQKRMEMLLNGSPIPPHLHLVTEWPRIDQGGADHLNDWLNDHPDARMVGIDVLQRMRPPRRGEGDLYAQDYEVMASLKTIADANQTGVTTVHHTRKADADDPFDMISGTTGLGAAIDTGLVLMRERGQADANLYVRGRDVEEQDLALKFDAQTGLWNLMGDADKYRESTARSEVRKLLLAHGPMTPKEVGMATGKKPDVTKKTLMRMFKDGTLLNEDGKYSINHMKPPDDEELGL